MFRDEKKAARARGVVRICRGSRASAKPRTRFREKTASSRASTQVEGTAETFVAQDEVESERTAETEGGTAETASAQVEGTAETFVAQGEVEGNVDVR